MLSPQLLAQIRRVALELPTPTLESIANVLSNCQRRADSDSLKGELLQRLPKASWRQAIVQLIEVWHTSGGDNEAREVAGSGL